MHLLVERNEKKLKIQLKVAGAGNHSLMKDEPFDFVIQVTPINEDDCFSSFLSFAL
jgi:hypothetical protein